MRLAFVEYGKKVTIVKIDADDKIIQHLKNLGLIIGGNVTPIMDQAGNMILKIKESRLAINKALAMKIQVA